MQQKYKHIIWALSLTLIIATGCLKTSEFPVEPVIALNSFEPKSNGAATLVINFTDGDGDIGLNPQDTLPPFDLSSRYYHNLFIRYYELQNGVWTYIPITNPPLSYRTPVVTPTGQNKSLDGTITVDLTLYYNPNSSFDTIKLDVQLVDRALHESNIIETGTLFKQN